MPGPCAKSSMSCSHLNLRGASSIDFITPGDGFHQNLLSFRMSRGISWLAGDNGWLLKHPQSGGWIQKACKYKCRPFDWMYMYIYDIYIFISIYTHVGSSTKYRLWTATSYIKLPPSRFRLSLCFNFLPQNNLLHLIWI